MIDYSLLIFGFAMAFGISYFLTPVMRRMALKVRLVCRPGKRRVHTKITPCLGGVAMYLAFVVTIAMLFCVSQKCRIEFSDKIVGLLIGSTLIILLGLWDDKKNIKPVVKLFGQIIVALLLFACGFRIEVISTPFIKGMLPFPLFLSMAATVLWFVAVINAMNLIDGLDGLAAGITVIASECLIFVALFKQQYIAAVLLTALAGSALGFLRFNFYPAKIFMGDAGSMFLGLILAASGVVSAQKSATAVVLLIPIITLAIPIYDTFIAIIRRMVKGQPIFKADKKHLHHRLLNIGLKQKQIVLFMYLVTLYYGMFAFLFALIPPGYAFMLLILLGVGLFILLKIVGFIERAAKLIHRLELEIEKLR